MGALNFLITLSVTYLSQELFNRYPQLRKYDYLGAVKDQEEAHELEMKAGSKKTANGDI